MTLDKKKFIRNTNLEKCESNAHRGAIFAL